MAERVPVPDLPLADERDRLDPAMRVVRKARLVVCRTDRLEMIEQQKRIEVVEPAGADTATQVHPGSLDDRLWCDDPGDGTRGRLHGLAFPAGASAGLPQLI